MPQAGIQQAQPKFRPMFLCSAVIARDELAASPQPLAMSTRLYALRIGDRLADEVRGKQETTNA